MIPFYHVLIYQPGGGFISRVYIKEDRNQGPLFQGDLKKKHKKHSYFLLSIFIELNFALGLIVFSFQKKLKLKNFLADIIEHKTNGYCLHHEQDVDTNQTKLISIGKEKSLPEIKS